MKRRCLYGAAQISMLAGIFFISVGFAAKPMAGLQLISPMVDAFWVSNRVAAPMRAAAAAASQPACPPPMTMTSYRSIAVT